MHATGQENRAHPLATFRIRRTADVATMRARARAAEVARAIVSRGGSG